MNAAKSVFTVGTLVYSPAGLVTLFGWLLWGDFMYVLVAVVMQNLLPLLLKDHGATNQQIAFFTTSLAMLANMLLNPIISYRSDRCRSRWGRRRPFIFWTTPFVVLFLAAIPFAPEILAWLSRSTIISGLLEHSPVAPLIFVFGLLIAGFQVFHMFVASVYYYLIPDVVPQPLLGRFYSLFRVFGFLAGMLFNGFLFGTADRHIQGLFAGVAVLYGISIMLMCWRVKEGEYPSPEQEDRSHWWSGAKNYVRECFGCGYFWYVFLTYSCVVWPNLASSTFIVLFYRDEIGFSLDVFGKLMAGGGIISAVLIYPVGMLLDRWGSHKMLITSQIAIAVVSFLAFLTIQGRWSAGFWLIAFSVCIVLPSLAEMK